MPVQGKEDKEEERKKVVWIVNEKTGQQEEGHEKMAQFGFSL